MPPGSDINLVSLFGGISGIEEAFRQLGLRPRTNMYEINPKALAISRRNFPDTIQRGSVVGEDWRRLGREIGPVDMLCGGFPCQDLSNANPKGLGLEGDRSGLFYNLVDAMETLQPKNFLIENVVPKDAKRLEDLDKVSSYLGVPYQILQNAESGPVMRKRAIWTNLPVSPPPERSPTALEFLAGRQLGPDVPAEALEKYYSSENPNTFKKHKIPKLGVTHDKFKTLLATANLKDVYNNAYQLGEGGPIQYVHPDTWYELFGFPRDYWKGEKVTPSQALSRLGNSFTIPMINRVIENYPYQGVPLKDYQMSDSGLLLPPGSQQPERPRGDTSTGLKSHFMGLDPEEAAKGLNAAKRIYSESVNPGEVGPYSSYLRSMAAPLLGGIGAAGHEYQKTGNWGDAAMGLGMGTATGAAAGWAMSKIPGLGGLLMGADLGDKLNAYTGNHLNPYLAELLGGVGMLGAEILAPEFVIPATTALGAYDAARPWYDVLTKGVEKKASSPGIPNLMKPMLPDMQG